MNKYLKGKQIINCAKARRPLPEDNNQGNQGNTGGNQGNTGGNHGGLTDEQYQELLKIADSLGGLKDVGTFGDGGTGGGTGSGIADGSEINW